jgi:hypothetical protein
MAKEFRFYRPNSCHIQSTLSGAGITNKKTLKSRCRGVRP